LRIRIRVEFYNVVRELEFDIKESELPLFEKIAERLGITVKV